MKEYNHKLASTIDILSLTGEIEHMRRHLILGVPNVPEDEKFARLVLASRCQKTRRKLQQKYFSEVKTPDWCIVKSAARLLQMGEELANGDAEEIEEIRTIVNEATSIATGEDISFCENCQSDRENSGIMENEDDD